MAKSERARKIAEADLTDEQWAMLVRLSRLCSAVTANSINFSAQTGLALVRRGFALKMERAYSSYMTARWVFCASLAGKKLVTEITEEPHGKV